MGVPEGEERGRKSEETVESFPNLGEETDVQEAHRAPNKMKPMTFTPRHIIKRSKIKESLKQEEKATNYI